MKVLKGRIGVEIWNGMYNRYGGHWQKAYKITGMDYFAVYFCLDFRWFCDFYDGHHSSINIGLIGVSWGGRPLYNIWKKK